MTSLFAIRMGKPSAWQSIGAKLSLSSTQPPDAAFRASLQKLESLNEKYNEQGLVVIGFPCDQFIGQEPETNETMVKVCLINFGVTFLLSKKN